MSPSPIRSEAAKRPSKTLRPNPPRTAEDLRAMKRALRRAPLGPKAALALASAAIELDERLAREALHKG